MICWWAVQPAAGVAGYEWWGLTKSPDRNYLLSKKLLTDLAETIIPATDTPGARESGAVHYMLNLLDQCTDTKTFNRFVEGLAGILKTTRKKNFNGLFSIAG